MNHKDHSCGTRHRRETVAGLRSLTVVMESANRRWRSSFSVVKTAFEARAGGNTAQPCTVTAGRRYNRQCVSTIIENWGACWTPCDWSLATISFRTSSTCANILSDEENSTKNDFSSKLDRVDRFQNGWQYAAGKQQIRHRGPRVPEFSEERSTPI